MNEISVFTKSGEQSLSDTKSVLLILEDFDEIRGLFANHFTKRGYDVISSGTLRDALEIVEEAAPRIILIDHELGGHSALQAIKQLRTALPNSCIIVVGGQDRVGDADRVMAAGASRILPKSADLTNLGEIVRDAQKLL